MVFLKKILKNITFYLCLIIFLFGIGAGFFVSSYQKNTQSQQASNASDNSEFHSGGYRLINPLYECSTGQSYGIVKLQDLEKNISNYITQVTVNNSVTRVAVIFRDLNTGPWFGINEHDSFAPSSLLKTPVMMAYYQEAEVDPSILSKKIAYISDPYPVIKQDYATETSLQKGNTYTIEQLIEHMIINSDNAALGLLEANIEESKIDKITLDLGITTATDATPTDFMDVSEYSTLFRVLYYSTYLNRGYSEKALSLLAQAEFKQGLVAQLPKNITVAHKFGERNLPDGTHQLHDCGIVYYPKRPYLLCIMTKGSNYNDLPTIIQQISGEVYKEFSAIYH